MTKTPKHDAMDSDTVAELLGVSPRMLRNYVNDKGLPSYGDKRGKTFKWAEVLEWFVEYRISLGSANGSSGNGSSKIVPFPGAEGEPVIEKEKYKDALTRKITAEADLKEIERAQKRLEVVAVGDAKVVLDRLFTNIKQKLLGVPSKLSSRLEGVKDRNQRKAILEAEMRQICQELSQADAMTGKIPGGKHAANE